jgi:hypothetical protein
MRLNTARIWSTALRRAHSVLVADDPPGLLDQVHVVEHQAVGLEDAVLVPVSFLGGDLLLDAQHLGVAAGQRLREPLDLDVDLLGKDPPLLHLDRPAQKVGHADRDPRGGSHARELEHQTGSTPSSKPRSTSAASAATASPASDP